MTGYVKPYCTSVLVHTLWDIQQDASCVLALPLPREGPWQAASSIEKPECDETLRLCQSSQAEATTATAAADRQSDRPFVRPFGDIETFVYNNNDCVDMDTVLARGVEGVCDDGSIRLNIQTRLLPC